MFKCPVTAPDGITSNWRLTIRVLYEAAVAGALVGGAQCLVGSVPHLNTPFMVMAGAMVGAAIAGFLGVLCHWALFRSETIIPALRSTALVAGVSGIIATALLRWWTGDRGTVFSIPAAPIAAMICAATLKAFMFFEKESQRYKRSVSINTM